MPPGPAKRVAFAGTSYGATIWMRTPCVNQDEIPGGSGEVQDSPAQRRLQAFFWL